MTRLVSRRRKPSLADPFVKECYRVIRSICGPIRYKIIVLLRSRHEGMTVTEIADDLGSSLSRVSHQLRILRQARLVKAVRRNREVVYSLEIGRLRRHVLVRCL